MIESLFVGYFSPMAPVVAEVPCIVDVENTADSLHAHVDLIGVEVGPGDTVIVYGAPETVPYGEKGIYRCRARVVRAGWIERLAVRATAYLGLTELYEVSFSDGRV
jgi:hypothetical protein